jgi:hypothetical protein
MAGDAIFRVAADVAEFVAGMLRAENATKRVGKSAGAIGDQITGSIIKVGLLNRALNAVERSVSSVLDKAQTASKSAGDRAIDVATSLSSLGVRDINGVTKRISSSSGGTTPEQKAAFARSLASASQQRRVPLSGSEAESFIGAFIEGGELGFGPGGESLIKGAAEGTPLPRLLQQAQERSGPVLAAMSDPGSPLFQGLRGRRAEVGAQLEEERAFMTSGATLRAESAAARVTAANDPGGPVSVIGGALGDTAGALANRGLQGADNLRAQADRATISQVETFRRLLTAPNFATDTR